MISFKENRVSLSNLSVTFDALETLDNLILYYNAATAGPAYIKIRHEMGEPDLQINRDVLVKALEEQRRVLIDYLSNLGIDYEG